jgi:hypothetical protein
MTVDAPPVRISRARDPRHLTTAWHRIPFFVFGPINHALLNHALRDAQVDVVNFASQGGRGMKLSVGAYARSSTREGAEAQLPSIPLERAVLVAHTGKIAPIDRRTFVLELAERFGPVLEALGKPSSNVPFMMPARLAVTPAEKEVTDECQASHLELHQLPPG